MIHGVTSVEELVYHYTTAETARDHILRNKTLKLGTYAKTNDPKETKTWQFNLGQTRIATSAHIDSRRPANASQPPSKNTRNGSASQWTQRL